MRIGSGDLKEAHLSRMQEPEERKILDPPLARYARELLRWNARVNLVSRNMTADELEDVLRASQALAVLLPEEGIWAEVGAGGGLLAVPLAVARPDLPAVWLEPRMRRRAFLDHIVRLLGLAQVEVLDLPLEAWQPEIRPRQIWVRALPRGPFQRLLRRRREILADGGAILRVMTGPEGLENADEIRRVGTLWVGIYGG